MADYFAILKKAILAQDVDSGETRRQVYEKARSALLSQLKAVAPPLPPSDIARQRLGLEEAIRTIERQIADGVFDTTPDPVAAAPAPPPPLAKAARSESAPNRRQQPAAKVVKNAVRRAASQATAVEEEIIEETPAEGTASAERGRARGAQRLKTVARSARSGSAAVKADPVSTVLNQSFSTEFDTHIDDPDDHDIVPDLEEFRPELVRSGGAAPKEDYYYEQDDDDLEEPGFDDDEADQFSLPVADPSLARPLYDDDFEHPEPAPDLPPSASLSPALKELRAERLRDSQRAEPPQDEYDDGPFGAPQDNTQERSTPFNSFDPVNNWDERAAPPAPVVADDDEPEFSPEDEPAEPYTFEEDSKPIVRTRFIEETQTRRPMLRNILQRNRTLISMGALGLVLIVVLGFVVGFVFDGSSDTPTEETVATTPTVAPESSAPAEVEQVVQPRIVRTVDPNASGKISDRLVTSPEGQTVNQDAITPPSGQDQTGSDVSAVPLTAPLNTDQLTTTPAATSTSAAGNERAILYEAPTEGSSGGEAIQSTVAWSLDTTGPDASIVGKIDVPEKGLFMTVSIRENNDETLPASHLIEVRFRNDESFSGKNIDTTPGMFMKNTEQERGLPLVGASAKVSDNYFWIALSNNAVDQKRNEALMLERGWFDIPVQYGTGRQAIVTVEKGDVGRQIFASAFAEWSKQ